MDAERALPWTALVEALGVARFEAIRAALGEAGIDALQRDAFLLNGAVGQLLRDLVPEDAPAEAVNAYGALLHMLYLGWDRSWPVLRPDRAALESALRTPTPHTLHPTPFFSYVQLPERLVWSSPEPGAAHEPVDGLFVLVAERARALAVLGFRPGREGLTTIDCDVALPASFPGPRPDGAPAFTSVIPGGDRARLFSVTDLREMAALALLAVAAAER
jgi:hypothetical protein